MGHGKTTDKKSAELRKLLDDFGIDFPTTRRNCLYNTPDVRVHEIDVMGELFNPDQGETAGSRRRCLDSPSIDLGGRATTDDSGKRIWKLSDFVCGADALVYHRPVSFVATPLSETPVSITVSVRSTGSDLVVNVFSWDRSGDPAPRVFFSWRCWAEAKYTFQGAPGPGLTTRIPR